MPGDAGGQHDARRGTETDQPAMPARRLPTYRARGFAEHRAIEPAWRFVAWKASIQHAEFAAIVAEQALQIVFAVARHGHDENLARMRASA